MKRSGFKGAICGVDNSSTITQAWNNGCVTDGRNRLENALANCKLVVLHAVTRFNPAPNCEYWSLPNLNTIILDATAVKGHGEATMDCSSGREDIRSLCRIPPCKRTRPRDDRRQTIAFFFDGKAIILTPHSRRLPCLQGVGGLRSRSFGARVIAMDPQAFHDGLRCLTSCLICEFLELKQFSPVQVQRRFLRNIWASRLHVD
ncbi:MAG: hypothetical protein IPP40_18435 [bacterium]|nr:hypothetical protein [bacterium]